VDFTVICLVDFDVCVCVCVCVRCVCVLCVGLCGCVGGVTIDAVVDIVEFMRFWCGLLWRFRIS